MAPAAVRLVALLLLLLPAALVAGQPFSCPAGCEEFGNCNLETGKCECPWGRSGDSCSVLRLAACRLHTTPDAIFQCQPSDIPKACECYRQCADHMLELRDGVDAGMPREKAPCFQRENLAVEEQTSNVPEESEPNVTWWLGYTWDTRDSVARDDALLVHKKKFKIHPLSACPESCNFRGLCFTQVSDPSRHPYCECYYGFLGKSCEVERPDTWRNQETCFNGCSGVGRCLRGFCHCQPGYFGLDCSRTTAYPPQPRLPKNRLAIYVYELPTPLTRLGTFTNSPGFTGHDGIYIAYQKFMAQLLGDWSVRTENPWEANLFYVPALTYDYSSNVGNPVPHIRKVITYVRDHYPFWNESNGQDHMLWVSGDIGACNFPPEMDNFIKLVHYCFYGTDPRYKGTCFDATKDVCVAANWDVGMLHSLQIFHTDPEHKHKLPQLTPAGTFPLGKRKHLFFFGGAIRPEHKSYSGGIRQELVKHAEEWNLDPQVWRINPPESKSKYGEELRNAMFCFAPYGHGWGIRMIQAITMGCIPIIVQDHVVQFFEDVLPYWKFSIRLGKADLVRLPEILTSVTDEEISYLQQNVVRYHRAFVWDKGYGMAYNYTIASMRRALLNMRAGYFK